MIDRHHNEHWMCRKKDFFLFATRVRYRETLSLYETTYLDYSNCPTSPLWADLSAWR